MVGSRKKVISHFCKKRHGFGRAVFLYTTRAAQKCAALVALIFTIAVIPHMADHAVLIAIQPCESIHNSKQKITRSHSHRQCGR